jgi:hypothetical protein
MQEIEIEVGRSRAGEEPGIAKREEDNSEVAPFAMIRCDPQLSSS